MKKKDNFNVPVSKKGKIVGYATKSGAKNVQKLLNENSSKKHEKKETKKMKMTEKKKDIKS